MEWVGHGLCLLSSRSFIQITLLVLKDILSRPCTKCGHKIFQPRERNEKNAKYYVGDYSFSPALLVSIPSPKYQSQMTNPLFFQYAFVTLSR